MKTLSQLEADLTNASTESETIDLLNLLTMECEKLDRTRMILLAEEVYARSMQGSFAEHPYYTGLVFSLTMQSTYWRGRGDPAKALRLLQEAQLLLDLHQAEISLYSQMIFYSYFGATYCELGDYVDALSLQLNAYTIAEEVNDPRESAIILAEIARIYGTAGDHEHQIEYLEKSLAVLHEVGDDLNIARYRTVYVEALTIVGRYTEALEQGFLMLEKSRQLQFLQGEMAALQKIGKVYMQRNKHQVAQPYLLEACQLARQTQRELFIFENLISLGHNSLALVEYQHALGYGHEALEIAYKNMSLQQQYESHQLLAVIFGAQGKYEDAYQHHQHCHTFYKKLHDEEANKQRRLIEVRYETESAKKEALLQKQKNDALEVEIERRKRAEAELRAANIELQRMQQQLETLSQTDALTQLANRRYFDQQLGHEIEHALHTGIPLSLVLLDLDYFKEINDSQGHQIGDDYLIEVAQILRTYASNATDTVARYGGEEFGLILVNSTPEESIVTVERLRANIAALGLVNKASPTGYQTISGGIVTVKPDVRISQHELIRQADRALYEAKRRGRNRIVSLS